MRQYRPSTLYRTSYFLFRQIIMSYSDIRNTNAQRVRNGTVAAGVGPFCVNSTPPFRVANIRIVFRV